MKLTHNSIDKTCKVRYYKGCEVNARKEQNMARIKIELTPAQAGLILGALENESNDDAAAFGEYSYWRCYKDVARKLLKAGFRNEAMNINGITGNE